MSGTILKNTNYIVGFCVYTGEHTKIMLNSEPGFIKRSNLDKYLSTFIFYILIVQIVACFVISLVASY